MGSMTLFASYYFFTFAAKPDRTTVFSLVQLSTGYLPYSTNTPSPRITKKKAFRLFPCAPLRSRPCIFPNISPPKSAVEPVMRNAKNPGTRSVKKNRVLRRVSYKVAGRGVNPASPDLRAGVMAAMALAPALACGLW